MGPSGKSALGLVMRVRGQGELLELVAALHSSCRLPRRLHGWQQQRDQNADDRNDHEQFH
jgi:hypothetical protein